MYNRQHRSDGAALAAKTTTKGVDKKPNSAAQASKSQNDAARLSQTEALDFIRGKLQYLDGQLTQRKDFGPLVQSIRKNLSSSEQTFMKDALKHAELVHTDGSVDEHSPFAVLLSLAFMLWETAKMGPVDNDLITDFENSLEHYNRSPFAKNTGPLTLRFLLSYAVSPGVDDVDNLLKLINGIDNFPKPFRTRLLAFHLLQQGIHVGDYAHEYEKFDLHVMQKLLPLAMTELKEINDSN